MANKCGNEVEQAGLRMEGGERDVMKEDVTVTTTVRLT